MPFLYAVLALVLIGVGLIWFTPRHAMIRAAVPSPTPAVGVGQEVIRNLSRVEIAKRLAVLAYSPAPKDLALGAMCYKVSADPGRNEYVCPVCGDKTLYEHRWQTEEIERSRRLVPEIRGIRVILDESEFCKKCSPKVVMPKLGLMIDYPGSEPDHRIWGVRSEDLVLLKEFMEGSAKHRTWNDEESPLRDHLKRLEELLGVKP